MKKTLKNTRKRIISVILTVMMLLSVLPTAAFAAEGDVAQIGDTTYTDLVTALDEAGKTENEGCTVKLISNINLPSLYTVSSGKFTIDLNGKKIETGVSTLLENDGGDLTVIDSVGGGGLYSDWIALLSSDGRLTVGKVDGTASDFTVQGGYTSLFYHSGSAAVYGATYIAGSNGSIYSYYGGNAFDILGENRAYAKKNDTTSLVDGWSQRITEDVTVVNHIHNIVDSSCSCGLRYDAQIGTQKYNDITDALDDAAKTENEGCTVTLLKDVFFDDYYVTGDFCLDLNGKAIIGGDSNVFFVNEGSTLTVYDSVGSGSVAGFRSFYVNGGTLILGKEDGTGGDFTVSGTYQALDVFAGTAIAHGGTYIAGTGGSIFVNGGYATDILGSNSYYVKKDDNDSFLKIKDGEVKESVTIIKHEHSFVDGICICGTTDGRVAQIGKTIYDDLKVAFTDAAKADNIGCTVKLLTDVGFTGSYTVNSGDFTIDLNGKTMENNEKIIVDGGKLTVIDSVGGGQVLSSWITFQADSGLLTFGKADGTASDFTVYGFTRALFGVANSMLVYGGTYLAGSSGTIDIKNGDLASWILGTNREFVKNDDTTFFVNAEVSRISDSIKVISHAHSFVDGECSCGKLEADIVAIIGDAYYSDFILACYQATRPGSANSTIKLVADTQPSDYFYVRDKLTVDLNGKEIWANNGTIFYVENGGDFTVIDSVGGGSISAVRPIYADRGILTLGKADGTANNFALNSTDKALSKNSTATVTFYGGTYNEGNYGCISFYGGKISEALPKGYILVDSNDKYVNANVSNVNVTVKVIKHTHTMVDDKCECGYVAYCAQIGESKYETLEDAFASAEKYDENVEIKLINDCILGSSFEVHAKNLCIDLNGYTIDYSDSEDYLYLCDGTYTIKGEGTVNVSIDSLYDETKDRYGSNAVINIMDGNYSFIGVDETDMVNVYGGVIDELSLNGNKQCNIYDGTIDELYLGSRITVIPKLYGGVFAYFSSYNATDFYALLADGKGFYSDSGFSFIDDESINDDYIMVKDHTEHIYNVEGFCEPCGDRIYEAKVSVKSNEGGETVTYYETITEALEYAQTCTSATVTLFKDVEISNLSIESGSTTLDLDKFSINPAETDATLTITGGEFVIIGTRGVMNVNIALTGINNAPPALLLDEATFNGDIVATGIVVFIIDGGLYNGKVLLSYTGPATPILTINGGAFRCLGNLDSTYNWNQALGTERAYYLGTLDNTFKVGEDIFTGFDGTEANGRIVVAATGDYAAMLVTASDIMMFTTLSDAAIEIMWCMDCASELYMLKDCDIRSESSSERITFSVYGKCDFYLNGYTISNGDLYIQGDGFTVYGGDGTISTTIDIYGTVIIDGGNYNDIIYADSESLLTIKDGNFNNALCASGGINIEGGTFVMVIIDSLRRKSEISGGDFANIIFRNSGNKLSFSGGTYTVFMVATEDETPVALTQYLASGKIFSANNLSFDNIYLESFNVNGYGFKGDAENRLSIVSGSAVIDVAGDKPVIGGFNQYYFTVEGRPSKLQIAHSDGSTYTFNRYSSMSVNGSRGVVSIKSYDANGNEVDSLSRLVAYEVWTINLNLSEDDYTVRAKFEDEWEKNTKNFSIKFDLTHGEVAVTEFTKADGEYLFKTNGTAQKLRIVSVDGATRTYDRSNSNVTITAYDVDGTEVEIGSENVAYEIWSVATTLADGSYTAITKYYDGGAYHWSETGFSFECNSSEN